MKAPRHTLILLFVAGISLVTQAGYAQDTGKDTGKNTGSQKQLRELEAEMKSAEARKRNQEARAKAAAEEAMRISTRLVKMSRRMRETEASISDTEGRIVALNAQETEKSAFLTARREELIVLIAALERLSRRPAALSLIQPGDAKDTARAASVLSTMVPKISAKAEELKAELGELTAIRTALLDEKVQLAQLMEAFAKDRRAQESLLAKRRQDQKTASAEARQTARRLAVMAEEAKSLQELLKKLEERARRMKASPTPRRKPSRPAGAKAKLITKARGKIPMPATGPIVVRFGTEEKVGTSKGIRIKGRDGGQVIATFDGEVVYAGMFRNYGQLLIIEHAGGYHSLIAGMSDLFATVGQYVLEGEPVGSLSKRSGNAELYLELRKGGRAIDPLPWLKR